MNVDLAAWWDEAWTPPGIWIAPWSRVLEGLTPEQAAWKPAPDRHSIWQLVNHIVFWHTYMLDRRRNGAPPPPPDPASQERIDRHNWEEPAEVSPAAWAATVDRFGRSHHEVRDAMADPALAPDLRNFIAHDAYHVGQIMQLRAMQGLAPIE